MNNLAVQVAAESMKKMQSSTTFKSAMGVKAGDVVVDKCGNEMVVIEIVNEKTGECFALFNGSVKRINTALVSQVVSRRLYDE